MSENLERFQGRIIYYELAVSDMIADCLNKSGIGFSSHYLLSFLHSDYDPAIEFNVSDLNSRMRTQNWRCPPLDKDNYLIGATFWINHDEQMERIVDFFGLSIKMKLPGLAIFHVVDTTSLETFKYSLWVVFIYVMILPFFWTRLFNNCRHGIRPFSLHLWEEATKNIQVFLIADKNEQQCNYYFQEFLHDEPLIVPYLNYAHGLHFIRHIFMPMDSLMSQKGYLENFEAALDQEEKALYKRNLELRESEGKDDKKVTIIGEIDDQSIQYNIELRKLDEVFYKFNPRFTLFRRLANLRRIQQLLAEKSAPDA
jgi:hypothetical protein